MPITKELKNIKTFESAGFTHEQAESLTDVIEESHADSQESLKEFIRDEFDKQTKDVDIRFGNLDNKLSSQINALDNKLSSQINALDNKLSSQIGALDNKLSQQISNLEVNMATSHKDLSQQISNSEVNMATSQKDLLVKIFAIIVGTVGVAVTIIKVF
ncbi:MAG: hypothetical protein ACUZ8O_06405 [Candidatus Anammoxibacter sp.]